jgi:hypothetical protein
VWLLAVLFRVSGSSTTTTQTAINFGMSSEAKNNKETQRKICIIIVVPNFLKSKRDRRGVFLAGKLRP